MDLKVKLDQFEGPLDLLLHLIDKNKINIYDIPISEITEQYMIYLKEFQKENLDVMSEFLVMAATLLDIKSKMLLPATVEEDGEEVDPRTDLVEQLLQYKMYKYFSYVLKDRQIDANRSLFKEASLPKEVESYRQPIDLEAMCKNHNIAKLNKLFNELLKKQDNRMDPERAKFGKIEREEISVEEAILAMKTYAKGHKHFTFREALKNKQSKMEMIVTFLAILELMKLGNICITQKEIFADIEIKSLIASK